MSSQETIPTVSQASHALSISNHPPERLPGPCLLHELIARQSSLGLPAISSLSHTGHQSEVSYPELEHAANRLAAKISALRGASAESDFVVPILIPQNMQLYVAMLAILKAGGAFCPLNLDAPPERIKFILKDVNARVVLSTPDLASKIPADELGVSLITLTVNDALEVPSDIPTMEQDLPRIENVLPESLAYVMYTSGSTGTPKGVGITHDAATQSILAHDRHIPSFRRFLQFASPTFDVSVFEIIFPLFRGCTLVTCDRSKMLDDLPAVMTAMNVDACELTPTVAGSLLRTRANVPSLKLLLTIGEMLTPRVVEEFGGNLTSPSMLWGMYGPTEAAIHCTLQTGFMADYSPRVIGAPLDTVSCFIAEIPPDGATPTFSLAPIGQVGELVVGGHQLARNYLNRPEKTDAAFIDSPFGRLYRTGDKASMRPDGTLECLGRISEGQIKLRGQRIELGEVEQAAMRVPDCRDVVSMVIDNILVVFCVPEDSSTNFTSDIILQTCSKWLPAFMIPGDVAIIEEFPRLPSGKIDRHQMRRNYEEARHTEPLETQHEMDVLEEKITAAVSNLLGSPVAPLDVMSAHGIDSLKAIQLGSALRKEGFPISTLDIVSSRTVAALCAKVRAADTEAQSPSHISQPPDTERILSTYTTLRDMEFRIEALDWCTSLQSSMLFETSVSISAYHNLMELELPPSCSLKKARASLEQVVKQNDILRSGFVQDGAVFVRVVFSSLEETQIQCVDHFTLSEPRDQDDYESIWLYPFQAQIAVSQDGAPPRLQLRMHHAIYDGWTVDLIMRDLSAILNGQETDRRPQFSEISALLTALPPTELDSSRAFWAEHLINWQKLSFPRLMSRPPDSLEPQSASRRLAVLDHELNEASRKLGCHPQVFFQATMAWIWGAILGTSDIVIGCVSSGRTLPVEGIEQIMGPCIASLPLRTNLEALRSVTDLLRSTQAANRKFLQYGILPLSEIRKAAGVKPGDALFDLLMVYQQSLYSHDRHTSSVREVSRRDFLETKILVEIEPNPNGIMCHLTYHADALSSDFAELLLDQIDCITRQFLADPSGLLSEVSKGAPSTLESIYNPRPATFSDCPDLATLFERSASAAPNAEAICFARSIAPTEIDSDVISYDELNNMSNKVAWYLHRKGVSQGATVAIIMEKSTLLYVAILGTLKAGCAYLPLLPTTPASRIQAILSQASVAACLVDTKTLATVADSVSCLLYDLQTTDLSDLHINNPSRQTDPSRPAYIIYTSGTTGVPKGIVVTQLNITSNLDVLSRIYPSDTGSRFLQLCSQAFDVSVFEIFFTWTTGACLCAGSNDTLFADLEQSIRSLSCTHLSLTPTVAALVSPQNVPRVSFLVTAGEPMTSAVSRSWGEYLFQGYGPAETTNICTVKKMKEGDFINHLGFAFDNVSAFVLSIDSTSLVPRGCFGEFCFGGDQVAKGYIDLPEVTSSKFIDHPSLGRIYRSGDMGRMLPDGSLLVSGRLDGQVKLRGQRIETGEIDSIVTATKEVVSCASLILQPPGSSSEQLVAFYTPVEDHSAHHETLETDGRLASLNQRLFAELASRLPVYMVPSYLVPLVAIPQTSSGKIDKTELRNLFRRLSQNQLSLAAKAQTDRTDVEEWSEAEKLVAQVIAQSLKVPQDIISRWQPLATIGLDSISAISVARSIGAALGRRIPISHILQNPYVARLAQLATESDPDKPHIETETADSPFFSQESDERVATQFAEQKRNIQDILPCTPLQEAMLSATGDASYSNQLIIRLSTSSSTMVSHWQTMVDRHEILRTCFITTTNTQHAIAQVILQRWEVPLKHSRQSSLQQAAQACKQRVPGPLDSQQPPYALDLVDIEDTCFLLFTCHHALYDGESMSILLQEVERLVRGEDLPSPVPYAPIIHRMLSPQTKSEVFWGTMFDGFTATGRQIPLREQQTSSLAPLPQSAPPKTYTSQVNLPLSAWQKVARDTNTSMLALGQTVWAVLLSIVHAQDDLCFGNVMSGRTLPVDGIERLVAPCFNTVPIRIETKTETQVSGLLNRLHQLNSRLLDHQFSSLRSIQKIVSSPGRSLFDTILLLQPPKKQLDLAVWELIQDTGGMDIPLVCELIPNARDDSVEINLHTNSPSLDPSTSSCLLQTFSHILQRIAQHPAGAIPTEADLPEDLRPGLAKGFHQLRQHDLDKQSSNALHQSIKSSLEDSWTKQEEIIRAVLSKLSGTAESRISRKTTIFQLGLDSINAVQIAAVLRKQGLDASTFDVIECPSSSELAQKIASRGENQRQTYSVYDIDAFKRAVGSAVQVQLSMQAEEIMPCTPVQCGMLKDFIKSEGMDYLNYLALDLDQRISTVQVEDAWKKLVQMHAILRTGFAPVDHPDAPFAMVQYPTTMSSSNTNLTRVDTPFNVEDWKADCSRHVLSSLDLPPWRITLAVQGQATVLHLMIHHALYDAYSLDKLLSDLGHIMSGGILPQSHESIRDAVSAILGSASTDGPAKAFWQEKSSEAILNRFPTMTPLIESFSVTYTKKLRSRLNFTALQSQASAAGVSIQAVLQAAWTRLLSAYLGEQTLVFGVVVSGRTLPSTEDAMFPCITTVPVISRNNGSNAELLSQTMEYNSQLLAHQHAPLSKIQHWLGHPGTRLFDTLLVYQKTASASESAPKLPWRQISDEGRLDYALSLEVEPSNNGHVDLRLSSRTDVLPQEQARIVLGQFDTILADLAANPGGQEKQIWLENPELAAILPPRDQEIQSEEMYLHQFVETTAKTHPSRLALEFVTAFRGDTPESHGFTFKELNEMGNRVANTLAQQITTRGIVAVHFEKCPEAFFAILGILKAGCSFLALDPSAPKARKEFILEDSRAVALLTRGDSLDFQPAQTVIEINQNKLHEASDEPCHLGDDLSKDDTCYCLYTSGTTGTPKGCEITHENAVQAMKAFQRLFAGHWDDESRWLQFASFHFDVSVLEQYWSWSVAMPLIVVPRTMILDNIAATIQRLRITHLDLTPSLARLLDPKDVPTLCRGVFITGGEALKQEILDTWGPQGVIYNAYGPTEATIGVTMYQRVPRNGRASNIGRQFDNVGTYVLEPGTENPVMKGAVGELCVSGKLVGKGYLNRPELTAERFPVLQYFKEKIYRTGDLVRVLHDGCFEFLGRADDQVKLRGQRLEIGEINHAIRTGVAAVKDVVTLVTKHPKADKDLLVTFVTSSEAATSTVQLEVLSGAETAKLRQAVLKACRNKLPGYMVPSHVFEVPFIPLSINNKAEMKVLGRLFASLTPELLLQVSSTTPSRQIQPATKMQRTILGAVSSFSGLPVAELSLSSNLFDLGIDSISCLRLSRSLKQDGLPTASPSLLLRNPVLGDLAEALSDPYDSKDLSAIREAHQHIQAFGHRFTHEIRQTLSLSTEDEVEYISPCTPLQEGMLSRTFTKGEESYFVAFRLKLSNDVDASQLRKSWDRLVARHPILRTRFVPTSGGFAQVALPPSAVPWAKYAVDNAEIEAVLQEAHSAWVKHNQNSIIKPLECLLVNSAGGSLLVVHIFHALYDGTSLDTMLQWLADDLSQRPHAQSSSFLNALPYGPLQNFDDSRPFWSQHLSSCTFEPLPRLMTADSTASHSMRRNYNIERLRETSKALNITLQSTILALWSGTFGKHFSPRAAMGVVVSGRAIDIDSAEGVIGPLFNTLPFHPDLAANNTWQKLTQRCHDFNTSTLPFQHVPLRNIQKWCCGGHPILDNLFVFQNDAPLANDASSLWTLEDSFMASDYPLAFEATAKGETDLQVQLVVRQDVVTESDLQRIFEDFEEAMFALSTGRAGTLRNPTVLLASQESSAGASPLTTRSASTDSAGHSTDVSAPEFTMSSFEWTETALAARDEISKLAQVSIESISESTSLLELGLDSIDLVSLSTRLKQKGLDITMSQLLRAQTIESMEKIAGRDGSRLSDERAQSAFETLIPRLYEAVKATGYNMENIENVLPATPLQESMMADMIDSDFERYFNHDIMEISPETVVESLLDAWRKVIFRSPILRTVFVQIDDPKLDQTFCQVIISDQLPSVRYIQLQDKQEIDNICADHRRIAKEANGLSQLLQLTIAHVGEQSYLMFSIAHALYDGWSLALLHQDVNSAYHNTLKDRPAPQEALESLLQPPSDRSQKFWSQYLAGAHLSLLPETTASPNDSLHHCEATSSVSSDVVALYCRNNSVTLQVLGQACWASVLATRLSALDVTFGVILSGRDTEEAQGLMFPTMNTVALRCILHGSTTSFLRYLQDTMADVHEHQAFPLRKAQLAGKQTPGRLFNTLFLLQRQPEASQDHTNAGSLVKSIQSSAATDFAVCVELEATKDQLVWRIAGKEAFTAENDLKEILQQLDRAMVRFVKGGDGSLIQFEGDHTSVCQLQPFAWPSDGPNPNSDVQITSTSTAKLPESEVESIIRGVLSEVSGIPYETISRDSTSYNLGLDSISLIKVSSLLKRNNIYVSIHGLLTASSLWHMASLANHPPETPPLDAQEIHSKIPESVKLNQILSATNLREADVVEILPAVPMQVYMMTAWQKSGGRVFYPTFRYQLNRHVSLETMQQGWSALVAAEAILRTCLVPTGDSDTPFLQIVLGPNVIGPHSQMSLPGNGSSSEDLSKCWPQVRMTAEQLIDGAWQLSLHIHHALYDGITLPSILNKLRHFLTNTETTMTETKFSQSWRSFVARHQSPSTVQERKSFWTEYLSGYCNPAPHLSQGASENRFAHLQRSAAVGMNDLVIACASNGVGLPALFFAVVAQSLYARRASRTGSVILGIYYSNRKEEDDTTMAFYPTLNLVPLTIMIQGETKAMDVARQVQQDLHRITSLVNSTVGLWEIKEWTGIEIDVFVNFLNLPKETQTSDMLQEVVDEQLFNEIDSPRPPTTPWDPSLDAPWLKNNAVLNAFPAAMDIEASVHGDALDVGVFGSAARATTEETRALVDIIGEGLSAALGG